MKPVASLARLPKSIFPVTRLGPVANMSSISEGPIQIAIRKKINETFNPIHFEIENESFKHSVPPGSESHFKVFVVSQAFDGVPLIQRHRMVMDAVKGGSAGADLPVHALSIQAKTPAQWNNGAGAAIQETPNCKGGSKHDHK